MKILHVSCSPRGDVAESHRLAQSIIGLLIESEPAATVITRVLGSGTIPHIDGPYATALGTSQTSLVELFPEGTMAFSEQLVQELESADVVVIGTPMHNFTVPSALKAWIDHIVRVRRTFDITSRGYVGRLRDRPVFVAISSGAKFSGERARQPDFLTPYLTTVLDVIGLRDVTFFSVQGTSANADALAEIRMKTNQVLQAHFGRFALHRGFAWSGQQDHGVS
jgi:FMN-dependent NADH-azoreductase